MFKIERPVIPLTISLALGIMAGSRIQAGFGAVVPALISIIIILFVCYYRRNTRAATAVLFFVPFFTGMLLLKAGDVDYNRQKQFFSGKNYVLVRGRIDEPAEGERGKVSFIMQLEAVNNSFILKGKKPKAIVYVKCDDEKKQKSLIEKLGYDRVVSFGAVVLPLEKPKNPGSFNFSEYLKRRGISGNLYVTNVNGIKIERDERKGFLKKLIISTRWGMIDTIRSSLKEPYSGLLTGIIFGKRKELPPDLEKYFQNSGTMHLFAASGLHVSIIAGMAFIILSLFRLNFRWKLGLTIPAVIFYAFLTGGSPSILRASIMAVIFLGAGLIRREYDSISSLFTAAFVMLLINPNNLYMAGFQLSFAAVLGILLYFDRIRNLLPSRQVIAMKLNVYLPEKVSKALGAVYDYAAATIIISTIAQLTLSPVLAFYFNRVSIAGVAANITLVPLTGLVLPLGMFGSLLGTLIPFLGKAVVHLLTFPLFLMTFFARLTGGGEWSSLNVASPGLPFFLIYYGLFLLWGTQVDFFKKNRYFISAGLVTAMSLLVIIGVFEESHRNKAVFFSVKRESVFLHRIRDKNILYVRYGGGRRGGRRREVDRKVIPYLREKGISVIDLLIVRGEGAGIYQELSLLLDEFKVERAVVDKTGAIAGALEKIERSDTKFMWLDSGLSARIGKADVRFLPADEENCVLISADGSCILIGSSPDQADRSRCKSLTWVIDDKIEKEKYETVKKSLNPQITVNAEPSGRKPIMEKAVVNPNCDRAVIVDLSGKRPRLTNWN